MHPILLCKALHLHKSTPLVLTIIPEACKADIMFSTGLWKQAAHSSSGVEVSLEDTGKQESVQQKEEAGLPNQWPQKH